MAYQVLARKYRPQRFADVVGQEHVTQTLINAIQKNRIAHAYLFVGPRGTGKTTIARIFAKCLNCTGGPKIEFADDDPRCQEINEGRSLDVLEIDGASNRGIEEIRALRETVRYAPATSRFKIYIIDEVHMLTKEAFNALLKTLEEPPSHVKFMFATTEPEKVLPTILSRCQRYDLRRIPVALIMQHLALIAGLEQVNIESAALNAIARGAEGCMRDAESALDQLISFCGPQIVESDVLSMFGLTSRSQVHALAGALLTGDMNGALRGLNELARNGKDLSRLLSDLLHHFRNLLLLQVARGDSSWLEVTEVETAVLKEQTATIGAEALSRIMEILTGCEGRLREAASKKTLIEVTLLKVIQARNAVSLDAVLQQLQLLRQANDPANPAIQPALEPPGAKRDSAPTPAAPIANAPWHPPAPPIESRIDPGPPQAAAELSGKVSPPAAMPAAAGIASAATVGAAQASPPASLEQLWNQVVEAVGRVSLFTRSYLLQARPISLAHQELIIGFDPEFADHLELVDNPKNRTLIQTKLRELGCGDAQVKFIKSQAPGAPAAPAVVQSTGAAMPAANPPVPVPQAPPAASINRVPAKTASTQLGKDDFKNDPLIKQALEIFKGQIVEVRA